MIIKNYCLQSDIVKVLYQFNSLCSFVVICLEIGITRPFVVYSGDWSISTITLLLTHILGL